MKTATKKPIRSGFCNPANDKESHARCRMAGCCCEHHTESHPKPYIQTDDVHAHAVAVGKFRPEGPLGYQAASGGPLRDTRAEAEADDLLERVARRIAARVYRCSWDQLPEGDRHSVRVLARQEIDDVRAAEEAS